MKKQDKIIATIKADKKLTKKIITTSYHGFTENEAINQFISHCSRYIDAIKERRMCCVIHSVSASGMSRVISFHECDGNKKNGYAYRQFINLFESLGYTPARNNRHAFTINGSGMDMVFHTNYTIIHELKNLGFITDKECHKLAQQTPVNL